MAEFLAQWGLEIILGLIATGITAYFTFKGKEFKNKISEYEKTGTAQYQVDPGHHPHVAD